VGSLQYITEAEFTSEVLQSDIPVIIEFSAPWCKPCEALTPLLERVARVYAGRIKVVVVDVDKCPTLPEKYEVQALPTLVFLMKHHTVYKLRGLPSTARVQQGIAALLAVGA